MAERRLTFVLPLFDVGFRHGKGVQRSRCLAKRESNEAITAMARQSANFPWIPRTKNSSASNVSNPSAEPCLSFSRLTSAARVVPGSPWVVAEKRVHGTISNTEPKLYLPLWYVVPYKFPLASMMRLDGCTASPSSPKLWSTFSFPLASSLKIVPKL